MELDYLILNTFTSQRYTGGSLALVKIPLEQRITFSLDQKQLIAREFNLPETLFLHEVPLDRNADDFEIEIFTVTKELPFAINSVMGAIWYCLHVRLAIHHNINATVTMRTKGATTRGSFVPGRNNIALGRLPHNIHINTARVPFAQIDVGRPPSSQIPDVASGFPIISIMKGAAFILADVANPAMLAATRYATNSICVQMDAECNDGLNGIFYYVALPSHHDQLIRLEANLTPTQAEDATPGTAACALACFLSIDAKLPRTRVRYWVTLVTHAGEVGRKSEVEVCVLTDAEGSGVEELEVCGRCVAISIGRLKV
jgi:predicted PhzF superfamily epimerase YddE/YHI9